MDEKEESPRLATKGAPKNDSQDFSADAGQSQSSDAVTSFFVDDKAQFQAQFDESLKIKAAGYCEILGDCSFDPVFCGGRHRAFAFLLYPESMNPKSLEILSESGAQGAISPLHDRDRWSDGSLKKAHFHGLIYQHGKTTYKALRAFISALGGVGLRPVQNITGYCRYLAHLDIQPDVVPGDVGKVHYSPDDIVCFGGFDVQSYIKATQSQVAKALKELYHIIRMKNFTAYATFIDYVYAELPEYEYIMASPHVTRQVEQYIRSRYAIELKRRKEADAVQIAEEERRKHDEIKARNDELISLVSELLGKELNHD